MMIRTFSPYDCSGLLHLFCTTIKKINSSDYSAEQISIWASRERLQDKWEKSFEGKMVWVAEDGDQLLGFCELTNEGYIDRFYCSADFIGKGIGRKLYQTLELAAQEKGVDELTVAASITAKPFFLSLGFELVQEQTVYLNEVPFTNFKMRKKIHFI